ncbi:MAG: RnfABCDGE type electron transport complex subunit D [Planctomycetes bacterium]|nr:RnfABCDGE type electron transport complex subunit D [Planctomycetota bacterium]
MTNPRLLVSASPHLHGPDSTAAIMWSVVGSLVPVVGAAVWFFGPTALLVVLACVAGALLPERLMGTPGSLKDGSAAITGILLALSLPPGIALWMAFVGGAFAISAGKLVFGGLGKNVFNPALLGRAFLQAAFPVALTTWPKPGGDFLALRGDTFSFPFTSAGVDTVTAATPLGAMKFGHASTPLTDLLLGTTGGCLGETSALLLLVCAGWLAYRGFLNWRTPVAVLGSVALFSGVLFAIDAARFPSPLFMLFSGGLMLGALFMATDMVTSPVTHGGCWIFGAGIGALVVLIRVWGGLAEGVMYAILLMNAMVPFIDRVTQPRVFGTGRPARTSGGAP